MRWNNGDFYGTHESIGDLPQALKALVKNRHTQHVTNLDRSIYPRQGGLMMCSRFCVLLAAILSGGWLAAVAIETLAQAYPARPVRLVVPYPPGGPTDILGRTVAQKLSEILPEPMVVENRPGAGGMIAHGYVAKAAADGYTLLLGDIGSFAVNPVLYPKTIQYNPRADFTPIGPVASGAIFLFVNASVPARNVQELIALAKTKPGTLSFASSGAGHFPTHIGPELFRVKNGLDVLHVAYKGSGPAMVDVVAGRVSFIMTTGLAAAKPHLDSGKVRAFALTGDKRAAAAPSVPTFAESGTPLPEMDAGTWWGLMGPAGLPRHMVVKLNESLTRALAAPDVRARLAALNMDPMTSAPEAFTDFINTAIETWAQVLTRLSIKLE
ncbi:MAG: tripartite tricarboxylate transporter substrate binding protein [Betaproteobacteria bacterium]|nr:tripartite tricarboxylate transporter substrate binding protein [Betaproteobacteria bacterium]